MTPTPRLFDYAASGNCLKVRMTLGLLGRPYERVPVDIFAGDTLGDDYQRVNPMRRTPVLEIAPERFLAESNAILLHLAEGTALLPEDTPDRADAYEWLLFERTFTPVVGGLRFTRMTGREEDPGAQRAGDQLLGVVERRLADRAFLAGDGLTVADLAMYAYAHVAEDAGFDLGRRPAVRAWVDRVAATPGLVNDLVPYPANARAGASRSIYDRIRVDRPAS